MKIRLLKKFDYLMFFAVVSLVTIGICFIYSSGFNSEGVNVSNEYKKQILFASTGLIILFGFMLFDYRKLEKYSKYFYLFLIIALIYTYFFGWGKLEKGANSWIKFGSFSLQPSEFGKIAYILFFASFLNKTEKMPEFKRFVYSLIILGIPVLLILMQPDFGTAMVYIPIFLLMGFVAEIPLRFLATCLATGLLTIIFVVLSQWNVIFKDAPVAAFAFVSNTKLCIIVIVATLAIAITSVIGYIVTKNKHFYWATYVFGVISTSLFASIPAAKIFGRYQVMRLIVFINPQIDPLDTGWNIIQSKTAIGSGNFLGQGFLQGSQSHNRFLPERSTDFIFSILSEEWGFVGGLIVFTLFFIILFRCVFILKNTTNSYGYYITTGILAVFAFHFVINVGMVMGIMPCTGIPLLLLSYGGSSLWTSMVCIGLLMGINIRQMDF